MGTAAAGGTRLTWTEFLDLPESDELRHAELIDGEIVVNPPTPLHQRSSCGSLPRWTRVPVRVKAEARRPWTWRCLEYL